MQLTLSTPFSQPAGASRLAPQAARPRDAVALSQLDQIAAQNLQASRHGLGASAMLLALIGGLVILGSASMWGAGVDEPRKAVTAVAEAPLAAVATTATADATPRSAPSAVVAVAAVVEPAALAMPAPAAAPAAVLAAEPVATEDDVARKARAKQLADVRRKAAQLAQQRALAEETQRLQATAQRREADQMQQQQLAEQARQRAAAEEARLASSRLALDTRRSVADTCAGAGSFVSQQFCRSRECGKSEHQGDAVCVRLRDNELAQQRASSDR